MEGKKAQATTEFLMTYGFMIFAALLIAGALAYFGISNMKNYVADYCLFDAQMPCIEPPYYDNGKISFSLKNAMPKDINITTITISDNKCGPTINAKINQVDLPYSINHDDIFGVEFECGNLDEIYDLVLTIKYANIKTGFKNAISGRVKGKVYS